MSYAIEMAGEYKFKVCLVGDPGVGKTSLVRRFVYNMFSDKYLTTIGTNIYKKNLKIRGVSCTLMVWDIMGQPGFREILKTAYFYGAQGIIAVADLTSPQTFESLPDWVEAAMGVVEESFPVIMFANKSDLEWKVDENYVKEVADRIGAEEHYITSAKTGENVEKGFVSMAKYLLP
jgi:small GTP-binding protein